MGEMAHRWGPLEELAVARGNSVVGQEERRKAKATGNWQLAERLHHGCCRPPYPTLPYWACLDVQDGRPWSLRLY
jgi:hypothetical protein